MKKIRSFILLLFYFVVWHSVTWSQILPVEVLEPPVPNWPTVFDNAIPEIYWLRCGTDSLDINFMTFWTWGPNTNNINITYYVDWSALVDYDFQNRKFDDPVLLAKEEYKKWNSAEGLVHDASSVVVDGRTLFLENAYMDRIPEYGQEGEDHEEEQLIEAYLSPHRNYIVGITHLNSVHSFHYFVDLINLRLWDSVTGKEVLQRFHWLGVGCYELYLSPRQNYAIARFLSAAPGIADYEIDIGEGWIYSPKTILIDFSKPGVLTSNRDVAFTSDDEYFVTERDSVPTLVHARTDTNILRYAMESPMISAAFSPDNQRLYIAGANSQIYVFDSHLPSHAAGWEVYP